MTARSRLRLLIDELETRYAKLDDVDDSYDKCYNRPVMSVKFQLKNITMSQPLIWLL